MTVWFPMITLWQPWASLIFAEIKDHETRGFPMPERLIGEWVAIHSAARSVRPHELGEALRQVCDANWGPGYETGLPHRKVLGLVRFGPTVLTNRTRPTTPSDWAAGNWAPHRYAWPIYERVQLAEPVFAKGRQGWSRVELDPPAEIGEARAPTQGNEPL